MAFTVLPVAIRCGRLTIENICQITRNCIISSSRAFSATPSNCQGTAAKEQKPGESTESNQELSDSEKKLTTEIELLNKEIVDLKEQNNVLNDKYKRSLADSENLRRRLMKQIEDAKLFGIQSFCKDLLDVADILGKATESVPKDQLTESNPHLKTLYEGLTMTEAQLHKVFKKHGLESLNPLDEKFDPNQHEALFQQEVEGKKPGTVVVVSKVGYKLHERIVRPALVGVAKI
ncbi:grpE protein homolog, mitochondrial [Leptopilina heterotoma]|uniref:grpE protein homolog, mitochondrial n=1 Tax=Leptopilina heterotoma TaxID=63436 RepID=UPI001CA91986|nr:grpE protein homolog, mitochondrial [Leptopilina heterotoma]